MRFIRYSMMMLLVAVMFAVAACSTAEKANIEIQGEYPGRIDGEMAPVAGEFNAEEGMPPGLAKEGKVPPGWERSGKIPPGLAKKGVKIGMSYDELREQAGDSLISVHMNGDKGSVAIKGELDELFQVRIEQGVVVGGNALLKPDAPMPRNKKIKPHPMPRKK
ncbi:hypothetical protein KQI84_13915 [bacterium]|nr:hypothetical protein [bacterium]